MPMVLPFMEVVQLVLSDVDTQRSYLSVGVAHTVNGTSRSLVRVSLTAPWLVWRSRVQCGLLGFRRRSVGSSRRHRHGVERGIWIP